MLLHELDSFENSFQNYGAIIGGALSAIGAGVSAATSAANQNGANELNLQIARETNETNERMNRLNNGVQIVLAEEAQEFQKSEAELAYKRSTASNQIAELIKAGYSEQQARAIVAGSGAAPVYTPSAAVLPTTTPGHADPATVQASSFPDLGSSFSALGSAFDDALTNPNGGAFGQMALNPVRSELSSWSFGKDKIDVPREAMLSAKDFENWALSQDEDSKPYKFVHSSRFRALLNTPWGRRAWQSEFVFNNTLLTSAEQVRQQIHATKAAEQKNILDGISIETLGMTKEKMDLELSQYKFLVPYQTDLQFNSLKAQMVQLSAYSDPAYAKMYKDTMIKQQSVAYWLASFQMAYEKAKSQGFESLTDTERKFYTMFEIGQECGLNSSDLGTFIAGMKAAGVDLEPLFQNVGSLLNTGLSGFNDSVASFNKLLEDPFGSLANWRRKYGSRRK